MVCSVHHGRGARERGREWRGLLPRAMSEGESPKPRKTAGFAAVARKSPQKIGPGVSDCSPPEPCWARFLNLLDSIQTATNANTDCMPLCRSFLPSAASQCSCDPTGQHGGYGERPTRWTVHQVGCRRRHIAKWRWRGFRLGACVPSSAAASSHGSRSVPRILATKSGHPVCD